MIAQSRSSLLVEIRRHIARERRVVDVGETAFVQAGPQLFDWRVADWQLVLEYIRADNSGTSLSDWRAADWQLVLECHRADASDTSL